jgi:hypothetical protein
MIRAKLFVAGAVGAGLAVGCTNLPSLPKVTDKSDTPRAQVADDATDDPNATVGSKTAVGNVEPIPVHGVGLVYKLPGTGSSPPADQWRAALEHTIRKNKGNPRELLDDPSRSTSLVLVSAIIPPGARTGDKLDVSVALPPGSKTTSLKGGVLYACDLQNMELAASAREALQQSGIPVGKVPLASGGTILPGHRLAVAEGPLVAGYDGPAPAAADGDDPAKANPDGPRAARVWGGARCLLDRPYYFLLNDNAPQPRLAMVIAERLNAAFHAPGDRLNKLADAKVQGKPLVVTMVPPAYRLNHGRFLLVARQVPLNPVPPDGPYRKQLENELLRPETALVAALKLEALGSDSRQPLRVGLQSDSLWVRFAAAEALAYLGHADGARDLAELAEKHPALRPQCLTALASLDDAVCLDQLADLMKQPDPQLRYGAFVALRSADENHEAIRGARVNESYWLHQVAADSDPLVVVGTDRRSEIILFGTVLPLRGPFSFPLGRDFTVSARPGEPQVTVTRIATKNGEPTAVERHCLADVGAVLRTLGELGGGYTEAVEFVRRAEQAEAVAATVQYDAAPRGLTVQKLAQIARADPSLERADLEVARAGRTDDLTPASYDVPTEGDAVQAKPKPSAAEPALNRDPGRLFGPKRDAEPDAKK